MKHKTLLILTMLIVGFACRNDKQNNAPQPTSHVIVLQWNKTHDNETALHAETGLIWALSFLGARWPISTYPQALQWIDASHIQLDLGYAGFNEKAIEAWQVLLLEFKKSEEYTLKGSVDLGRFVMLSLNASKHYYKITGMPPLYEDYAAQFTFDSLKAAVVESVVSIGERQIQLPGKIPVENSAYITHEGTGKLANASFLEKEREVMDIMPNGQLRFGVYNMEGKLLDWADTVFSAAGKPAKCLWCHETNIQRAFNAITSVQGYYSIDSFQAIIVRNQQQLEQYRSTLQTQTNFTRKQDHTLMELLYIGFSEPSAARLAEEWGISQAEAEQRLQGLSTHIHIEFPFLGNLYWRYETDLRAPYKSVKAPYSAREGSDFEPNLIP